MMSDFSIEYPPGFEDYEWEVQAKGWLRGVVVVIHGRRHTVTVYDPTRLAQDINDALKRGDAFLEENLVVVRSVTPENIAAALAEVVRTGRAGVLRPENDPTP